MISQKLLRFVQGNANRLTTDLVQALQEHPRTYGYRSISPDRLIELKSELYVNLGSWLSARSKFALESRYRKLGRQRYLDGIPLSHVIHALNLTKTMLLHYIRRALPGDSSELPLEHELVLAISEFFDEATYFASMGYEDACRASLASPEQAEIAKRLSAGIPRLSSALQLEDQGEIDLPISRAGDIGEASG